MFPHGFYLFFNRKLSVKTNIFCHKIHKLIYWSNYNLNIYLPPNQSLLLQLMDTKSTDKKQTLLHYIVNVVTNYYPDIRLFYNELRYVDRARKGIFIIF